MRSGVKIRNGVVRDTISVGLTQRKANDTGVFHTQSDR